MDGFIAFAIEYRISMLFLFMFLLEFLPLRYSRLVSTFIAVIGVACSAVLDMLVLDYEWSDMKVVIYIGFMIVLVTTFSLILCKYRDFRAVFTAFSAACAIMPGDLIFCITMHYYNSASVCLAFEFVTDAVVLFLLAYNLRGIYIEALEYKTSGWLMSCLFPALFFVLVFLTNTWPMNIYKYPMMFIPDIIIMAIMIITYMLLVNILHQKWVSNMKERQEILMDLYIQKMVVQNDAISNAKEQLAIQRHDMRHQYRMIESLANDGDIVGIKNLLSKINRDLDSTKPMQFCENVIVDGLLSIANDRANSLDVDIEIKADVPKNIIDIDEFEFATVVSNLLDNAIDAASEVDDPSNRKVKVLIAPRKEQMLLEIKNTYLGDAIVSNETGGLISRKGEGHGYGLMSVRAFAKKHNALFELEKEDEYYCARLITN